MLHYVYMDEIEQRERLITVLTSLEDLTKKQVALRYVFLKGIIYGLGTVIGATVLIWAVSYLFVTIFGFSILESMQSNPVIESSS